MMLTYFPGFALTLRIGITAFSFFILFTYFIAPCVPSGRPLAGKKFYPRHVTQQLHNPPPCFFRLFAMFLYRGLYNLMYCMVLDLRRWFESGRYSQQTNLGVRSCIRSHAPKVCVALPVLLDPHKGTGLILETPCFHDAQGIGYLWECRPHEAHRPPPQGF